VGKTSEVEKGLKREFPMVTERKTNCGKESSKVLHSTVRAKLDTGVSFTNIDLRDNCAVQEIKPTNRSV
jgi:hypothetical protein